MKTYQFTSPEGIKLNVNSPDGSMPSEGDLDQLFSQAKQFKQQTHDTAIAADKANPDMQGGANAPALVKAKQDIISAKSRTNPVLTTLKGLSDTSDQIMKVVPFGDRTQPMTPRNIAGEGLKAASLIPGVGPMVGGASYMAGQQLENPKTSVGGVATAAALGAGGVKALEVAGPFVAKAGQAIGKSVMDMLPKPVTERMFQLYNDAIKPRIGQFKTKGDLESYKKDQLGSTISIKNNPNLHFEDPVTGEIYNKPRNKQDYLDAIDQTQQSIWKDKVQAMSKGATAKGVMIDTEAIAQKSLNKIVNNKNMKLVDPNFVNEAKGLIERAKVTGRQTPEEVEDLLKILNNKGATYWANKDKVAADAYIELANALRTEMDNKIESALGEGGYLDARREYGALKRIKSDVLRSTASQIFRGDSTLGDKLLDTFAGEELVRGLLTMRPESIAMSGTTKAYQMMRQYLRNPDRKVAQMFQLADRYVPKSTEAEATYAAAHNPRPTMRSGEPNVSEAEIMAKRLPGQPTSTGVSYQTKSLPDKSWMNSEKTSIRPQPKFEGDVSQKPIYQKGVRDIPVSKQTALPPSEKRLSLPQPVEVKGEGFTMNNPPKNKIISEREAGREPINEQEVGLEGEPEVIKGEKTKAGEQRQLKAQEKYYKIETRKDAKSFLKYMQGKLSSEHLKPNGFLREEHEPIAKYRALFSPNGQYSDKVVSEAARLYPRFFDYKKPEELSGEEIVGAVKKAIKALDERGVGYLTKNKELVKGQIFSKQHYLGSL